MGDWVLTIKGTGAHHNGKDYDADKMAQGFVHELKRQGHLNVEGTLHFGGYQNLDKPLPEIQQMVDTLKENQPEFKNQGLQNPVPWHRDLNGDEFIRWTGNNWPDVHAFIYCKNSNMTHYALDPDNVLTIETADRSGLIIKPGNFLYKDLNGRLH